MNRFYTLVETEDGISVQLCEHEDGEPRVELVTLPSVESALELIRFIVPLHEDPGPIHLRLNLLIDTPPLPVEDAEEVLEAEVVEDEQAA